MNLSKKKELAKRTFNIGKHRIIFVKSREAEIKEAITKQDIRDLHRDGAILIKEVKGRKTIQRKKKKRTVGNVRKKVNRRKRDYVTMTRKLRNHISEIKNQGALSSEEFKDIRKKIRNRFFKSKAQLKEYIGRMNK